MATEIERKFLVFADLLPPLENGRRIKQGYIATGSFNSVRSRIKGEQGFLTIKGASDDGGLSRAEFEYEIPLEDAHHIIDHICDGGTVDKTRYEIPLGTMVWELDVFSGANEGLVMAEVELPDVTTPVELPPWIKKEVTGDVRYYNSRLAVNPWSEWPDRD